MTITSVGEVPEPDRRKALEQLAALLNQKRVRRPRPVRKFDKPSEPHKDEL